VPALRAVHVGCSGWDYRSWRGGLYPQGLAHSRWLARYAEVFGTVEVNATFYGLPRASAVAGWVEATPPGFLFAVKASRYLTHVRRLRELRPGLERLLEPLGPMIAAGRLGPLLWQLPERFRRDDDRLAEALGALPPGRHAFEFRHPSWFEAPVTELLRAHGVALVIGDHPARPFQAFELTADFTFVRLHYGARGRRGNYSDRELREWAARIAGWRRSAEAFVYLNNDWEGFAPRNARRLMRLLEDDVTPRPS
jgi:uncharacterized protein YecE (DUF72 family)